MEANSLKYFSCTLLFFVALYSCNTKEKGSGDEPNQGVKSASFETIDSIKVDFLGMPAVQDIDPISKTLIFLDDKVYSQDIYIADFDGEILNSFSKFGDMPDNYGGLRAPLKIIGKNEILAYGIHGFFKYDFSGKNRLQVRHEFDLLNRYSINNMGTGMEEKNEQFLYLNSIDPKLKKNDLQFYDEINLLTWMYPKRGEKEQIVKFPESSLFKNGKFFYRDSWSPVYTLSEDLVYVIFGMEPVIYMYSSSSPYELLNFISLDLPGYQYFKGSDIYNDGFEIEGLYSKYGRIINLKKVNGYFLVCYFPGYDSADREEGRSNKTLEEKKSFNKRMEKKYPYQTAVFDSLGNFIDNIHSDKLVLSSLVIRNNELWMKEKFDTEIERDYFRLFRVALKLE